MSIERGESQKTYDFVEIWERGGINICTTDSETVENLYSKIKAEVPSARFMWAFEPKKIHAIIDKLQGKDLSLLFWIIGQLGKDSWEPFSVFTTNTTGGSVAFTHYCLKKETLKENQTE